MTVALEIEMSGGGVTTNMFYSKAYNIKLMRSFFVLFHTSVNIVLYHQLEGVCERSSMLLHTMTGRVLLY